ncbi:MAG: c-type cytochrome [Gemmobacter sp.]
MRAVIAILSAAAGLAGVVGCSPDAGEALLSGRALYADYCAACHGAEGRGDGPAATGLRPAPTDLTRLAARNRGVYPEVRVMGKIYGYTQGRGAGPMPEFGPLMEGRTVLVETAPGVLTPTPERLVKLADHVRSLQR